MFQILYKYFILNNRVWFPGIGVVYIRRNPAYLDFSNKTFVAPSAQMSFSAVEATPSKRFYSFLAKEQQIEETEAVSRFSHFSNMLADSLLAEGRVDLPGFGSITKEISGSLHFHSAGQVTTFLPSVSAERTIRKTEESEIQAGTSSEASKVVETASETNSKRKHYWWVFAIVLAAVAIAAIVYYYYQNGDLR